MAKRSTTTMSFDYKNLKEVQFEITTYCNASCPQCPRNINGGDVNPYLPLCHLSKETIFQTFPIELCNRLSQIFFCGSYGDPIVHPEFLEIVKDFRKKSKTLWIYIHTILNHDSLHWCEKNQKLFGYTFTPMEAIMIQNGGQS